MAGWNAGGGKLELPISPTPYVFQIADVKTVQGKNPKTNEPNTRWQWGVDIWLNNQWVRKSIYTGTEFQDISKISSAQFVPELMKLVRACKRPLPTNAAEAAAWSPDSLIGCRAGIRMVEEDGLVQKKFVQIEEPAQPAQPMAPVPQPVAPIHPNAHSAGVTPPPASPAVEAPVAPVAAAPTPAPAAPPAPASPADPFAGDPGSIPPAAYNPPPVASAADVWA